MAELRDFGSGGCGMLKRLGFGISVFPRMSGRILIDCHNGIRDPIQSAVWSRYNLSVRLESFRMIQSYHAHSN